MLRVFALAVTLQFVARPLVLGEDPGMLSELSDTGGMGLTLLWFVLAIGWSIWRVLSRSSGPAGSLAQILDPPNDWLGRTVEMALLGIVLAMFASAEWAAHNHYPARLIAWEWLGVFLAFFVVRRVSVSPQVQQRLLTVLLAGAVAGSVHGIYQATIELPATRAANPDVETLRQNLQKQEHRRVEPDDPELVGMAKRIQEGHLFGTYAHPNSYAGYLALFLPGLIGAAYLAYRAGERRFAIAAAACTLLAGTALWLTHSRGAMLAVAGVAAGLALASRTCRNWLWRHRLAALVTLVLVGASGVGGALAGLWSKGVGKEEGTAELRLLYWRTTWRIIRQHPWLGVGPGNFGNAYLREMEPNAAETIKDPHNFALDLWSSGGIVALAAGLTAVTMFFLRMVRSIHGASGSLTEKLPQEDNRWEYYIGGIFGLLLGVLLRGDLGNFSGVVGAGIHAVAWFAAYGLLEHLSWPPRARAIVLTAGVAALLLNLCVSGGIGAPSVAILLWSAAALAFNALPPVAATEKVRSTVIWPAALVVPVLVAVGMVYVVFVYYPVTSSMALMQQAELNGLAYRDQVAKNQGQLRKSPETYFETQILAPLQEATRLTPDNPRPWLRLAPWYAELRDVTLQLSVPPSRRPAGFWRKAHPLAEKAVQAVANAIRLDPEGPAVYLADYQLRTLFFARTYESELRWPDNKSKAEELRRLAHQEYSRAAAAMETCHTHDPTDLKIRYLRAVALGLAGDKGDAANQAREALDYDADLMRPTRRLSNQERQYLLFLLPEGRDLVRAVQAILSATSGGAALPGGPGSALPLALADWGR